MFLLNIKRFVKSPVFLVASVCYVVMLYTMVSVQKPTVIEDVSNSALVTQTFSFLFFMILSYEFFYQTRRHKMNEIIAVSKLGEWKEKMYGLLLFSLFDLVLSITYFVTSVWGFQCVIGEVNQDWNIMLLQVCFEYHFLLYLFAILVGMLASMIQSRLCGFTFLLGVFSVFSRVMLPIIMQFVNFSVRLTHIFDVLGIMNRSFGAFLDLFYNYSTEAVNIQRIMVWILLTTFLLALSMSRKKINVVTIGTLLATIVMFVLYIQPSGERYISGDWGVYMADQHYYSQLFYSGVQVGYEDAENYEGIGRKYKDADFQIQSYTGELSAKRLLKASIDVVIDKDNLDEYCFTLYHGYDIKKITDQDGNHLPFEQDVDHVLIKNPSKSKIEKIHFEYAGYSRKYVATNQAIFLAGNFPYLPYPGWMEYKPELVDGVFDTGSYNLRGLPYETEYDISFDTEKKILSNLEEISPSRFAGKSQGATFVQSKFMRERKLKHGTLYYSMLDAQYYEKNIEYTIAEWERNLENAHIPMWGEDLKIFDVACMGDGDLAWYMASDHTIDFEPELGEFYLENGYTPNYMEMDDDTESEDEEVD
nr:hypothetical protein [Eubacterium sp.]